MSLPSGAVIGPYRVSAQLGAGGMGEVYRARDTKLSRDVAIKVLPRRVRARSPIAWRASSARRSVSPRSTIPTSRTIYGLEESAASAALVMELVDGDDARRAHRARPDAARRRAVDRAPDCRRARSRARAGHRPSRSEAGEHQGPRRTARSRCSTSAWRRRWRRTLWRGAAIVANSPTLTRQRRATGIILGTAAYMSPEQARGQAVDKRTDIWAFGCVLFEMLTGRPPFGGATVTDIYASILEREPDWAALPTATPPAVVRLIRRCLEKDVRSRLRDIGDARPELNAVEQRDVRGDHEPPRAGRRRGWVLALARSRWWRL